MPAGFSKVEPHDYNHSGFDRGHMCPAKDRSATEPDCQATFYMTNLVPQSPHSNQRGWEKLNVYCRHLTKDGDGHVLQIACGPYGIGGIGKGEVKTSKIGEEGREITVPAKLWKVIMVLPRADAKPRKNTRVIAIIMPNDQTVDNNWREYRVSAREVKDLTGYKFFPNVPEDVANAIKNHKDAVKD